MSVGVGVIREDFTEEVAQVNEDAGERRKMEREPQGKMGPQSSPPGTRQLPHVARTRGGRGRWHRMGLEKLPGLITASSWELS